MAGWVRSTTPTRGIACSSIAGVKGRWLSMATALLILGILCLLAACHPFVTYPWSLIVLQALHPIRRSRSDGFPDVPLNCAICVCAYNEERAIALKAENLLELRAREPGLEILVYVDGS